MLDRISDKNIVVEFSASDIKDNHIAWGLNKIIREGVEGPFVRTYKVPSRFGKFFAVFGSEDVITFLGIVDKDEIRLQNCFGGIIEEKTIQEINEIYKGKLSVR
jgi:nitrogen regulatory protein PII-like uncharacterized protein